MDQQGGLSDTELVRWALGATTAQERAVAFEAIADKYRLVVLRQCASWYPDPAAAQDVGQAAFEAAFTLLTQGKGPERPDKLAGWLIEIARRRGREYIRKTKPSDVLWAELPEGRGLDETEDDDEPRSGSAVRRAHATRLVERVVVTLTSRQQEIYQLRFVQELTGKEIAGRLGIANKAASNEATIVQGLIADGFGALMLSQEGRIFCRDLARIIDSAATPHVATSTPLAAAAGGIDLFTAALRQRIVNHFNDCNVCDNCRICNDKRRQLAGSYAPALIPILFAGEFHERVEEVIRRVVEHAHTGHHSSSHLGSSPPTGTPSAGTAPAAAAGLSAMAGGAAGSATADALVTRLQSLVRRASQSSRLPRWLRRAIPPDAGPGASVAIVAGAVAAVVVVIVVISAVATALTSSSPTPQVAAGNPAPAATSVAGPASAGSSGSSCSQAGAIALNGTATLPASAASVAHSMDQLITNCTGKPTSATCTFADNDGADDSYACTMSAQEVQKLGEIPPATVYVNKATGVWNAYFAG